MVVHLCPLNYISVILFYIVLKFILVPTLAFSFTASVTCSTEQFKTKTVIVMENEKMWLQLNKFSKKVLVLHILNEACLPFSLSFH